MCVGGGGMWVCELNTQVNVCICLHSLKSKQMIQDQFIVMII